VGAGNMDATREKHRATVRVASIDAKSATITFDTSVAQGSITSPRLFNIFINALLRTLAAHSRPIEAGLRESIKALIM